MSKGDAIMALILSRKENESIQIDGDIVVTVLTSRDGVVKLAIDAPKEVEVWRTELLERDLEAPGE